MTKEQKDYLLKSARDSIESHFRKEQKSGLELPSGLDFEAATFVTLAKDGELRGCVGCLEPFENIVDNIQHNAYAAAFSDNRFPPVVEDELQDICLEISILSSSSEISYRNKDDLISKIKNNEGLTIELNNQSATYLPQVWKEIPNKSSFVKSLLQKAGLPEDVFENAHPKVSRYSVESFRDY